MAQRLAFCDGFAHYATADLAKKWSSLVGSAMTINAATGRWGGNSLRGSTSANGEMRTTLGSSFTIGACAVAAKQASAPTGNEQPLLRFLDGTTEQLSLRLTTGGNLIVSRNGTTLATSTSPISFGVFHHFVLSATIDASAGAYAVRMDGAAVAGIADQSSGQNTRGSSTTNITAFGLKNGSNSGSVTIDYTDAMIFDVDNPITDILADCKIETLYPSGAGNYAQFTASTGSNATTVDETSANTTDYNTSTADNQIDSFVMTDLVTASGTPISAQISMYAQKTDAGAKNIAGFARASDNNDDAGAAHVLSSDFAFILEQRDFDHRSGGNVAWTIGHVNGAEFGYESRAG